MADIDKCGICDANAAEYQYLDCELCDAKYHLKCLKFSETVYKVWSSKLGICFICDDCRKNSVYKQYKELKRLQDVMQKYVYKIDESIQKDGVLLGKIGSGVALYNENLKGAVDKILKANNGVEASVKEVESRVMKIESEIAALAESQRSDRSMTYADVLKVEGKKAKPVCVIRPKNDEQELSSTQREIKSVIDPACVAVSGMRGAGGGGVAIICDSESAQEEVRRIVEGNLGSNYEVSTPGGMHPRIKISGVSEERPHDELKKMLITQNSLQVRPDDLKVLNIRRTRSGNSMDVVIELPPAAYSEMLSRGRVKLGWDMCRVFDGTSVRKCGTCGSYGHLKNKCVEKQVCCFRCAAFGHVSSDCGAAFICCINCKRFNDEHKQHKRNLSTDHHTNNEICPLFQRAMRRLRERINYS